MRRRFLASFLPILFVTSLAAAQAEPEDSPPPEYEQLVQQALEESAAGRFEEARVLFRQAHAVFPNARTLRGIGMVAFEVRDYPDAIRNLRQALAAERRPLTDAQRAEVTDTLERAYDFVGRYDLDAVPEGATILVDGHEAESDADRTLLLPVGRHAVVVRTAARSWDGRWTVRGGENEPLPIVFDTPEPLTAPAPAPAAPVVAAPPPPPDPMPPTVVTIVGAVVAAIGIALLVAGLVDVATVQNAGPGTEWSSLSGAYGRAAPLTATGIAALALGGATAVFGGIWLGVASSADAGSPAPTAFGVRLGATW